MQRRGAKARGRRRFFWALIALERCSSTDTYEARSLALDAVTRRWRAGTDECVRRYTIASPPTNDRRNLMDYFRKSA